MPAASSYCQYEHYSKSSEEYIATIKIYCGNPQQRGVSIQLQQPSVQSTKYPATVQLHDYKHCLQVALWPRYNLRPPVNTIQTILNPTTVEPTNRKKHTYIQ